ncbi:hypothetical protein KIN20_018843, partial [Parelaphostrongylus tenuis]
MKAGNPTVTKRRLSSQALELIFQCGIYDLQVTETLRADLQNAAEKQQKKTSKREEQSYGRGCKSREEHLQTLAKFTNYETKMIALRYPGEALTVSRGSMGALRCTQ